MKRRFEVDLIDPNNMNYYIKLLKITNDFKKLL